jgi:excisionase family DNA binding protein
VNTPEVSAAVVSPLLDVHQAARYLGAKPCTVRKLVRTGSLPFVKVGHRHMILKTDLDAWIRTHRTRLISRSKVGLTVA